MISSDYKLLTDNNTVSFNVKMVRNKPNGIKGAFGRRKKRRYEFRSYSILKAPKRYKRRFSHESILGFQPWWHDEIRMVVHPFSNFTCKEESHKSDRRQTLTKTTSFIAASFRTWRVSCASLQGVRSGWLTHFQRQILKREFSPARADFGNRAPLAPRLAQPRNSV